MVVAITIVVSRVEASQTSNLLCDYAYKFSHMRSLSIALGGETQNYPHQRSTIIVEDDATEESLILDFIVSPK